MEIFELSKYVALFVASFVGTGAFFCTIGSLCDIYEGTFEISKFNSCSCRDCR